MTGPTGEAGRGDTGGEAYGRPSTGGSEEAASDEGATPGPSTNADGLDLDHVFGVLDHPRRRYLLYALATDGRWTLTELATKLAAWETGVDEGTADGATRDRVYVSLYHVHVPKLVDEGVVRFDEAAETIVAGPNAEQVLAVLEGAGASLDSRQEKHAGRKHDESTD